MNKLDESFKKAFFNWENQAAEIWAGMLRNPDFLKQMWQTVETTITQQRTLAQFVEQQMTAANLPTSTQQKEIQAKITQMQEIVSALHEQVDGIMAAGNRDGG